MVFVLQNFYRIDSRINSPSSHFPLPVIGYNKGMVLLLASRYHLALNSPIQWLRFLCASRCVKRGRAFVHTFIFPCAEIRFRNDGGVGKTTARRHSSP